jgi:hypothetical protein
MRQAGFVSSLSNYQVLGPSDVRMAVAVPAVDTKSEFGSVHHTSKRKPRTAGRRQAGLHVGPGTQNTEELPGPGSPTRAAGSLFRLDLQ